MSNHFEGLNSKKCLFRKCSADWARNSYLVVDRLKADTTLSVVASMWSTDLAVDLAVGK